VVVEENPGFKSEKPTEVVHGNRRRTAHHEGSCCPLGGVRSSVMAKKYSDVREALIDAGWQAVRQRGLMRSGRILIARSGSSSQGRTATRFPWERSVAFDERAA